MKCWRHDISVRCGRQAERVVLFNKGEPKERVLGYCNECYAQMSKIWDSMRFCRPEDLDSSMLLVVDVHSE